MFKGKKTATASAGGPITPPPAPMAPPAERVGASLDADIEARKRSSKRRGLKSTIMAGETGDPIERPPLKTVLG